MVDLVASEKMTQTVEQQRFADYNCNNRAIVGGRAEVLELATMQVQRFSVVCGLLVASCVAKWHKKEEGRRDVTDHNSQLQNRPTAVTVQHDTTDDFFLGGFKFVRKHTSKYSHTILAKSDC